MERASEELQTVRDALADFERVLERYEEAKSRVEGTQARRFDGVAGDGNSVQHVASDALENYIQAREEMLEALNYWLDLLKEQEQQAEKLPDSMEKLILDYRYFFPKLLTWAQIAARAHVSTKYCYELHKKALALMEKVS